MTGVQRDILIVILESQLNIERAKLAAAQFCNVGSGHYKICQAAITEIERQLKHLKGE